MDTEIPFYGDLSLEELAAIIYETMMDAALVDVLEKHIDKPDDTPDFIVLKTALEALPYALAKRAQP